MAFVADLGISIVIPTWNGRHILSEFFPSVIAAASDHAAAAGVQVEIVVVDDGSTDDSVAWLTAESSRAPVDIRIVRNDRNLGFGEACNRGVREARYPLILLLNNDVELDGSAIAPLARHFARPGPIFAVHGRVIDLASNRVVGTGKAGRFARGFLRVHPSYDREASEGVTLPSMFAGGGSALVQRARFIELGGFDPIFAPYYYEDVELCYRAWKRGFVVVYEPGSTMRHRFSSTIGAIKNPRVGRVSQRNRLLFHWIHLHDRRWMTWHTLWLPLLAVASVVSLRPAFVLGLRDAIRRMSDVSGRRGKERELARRTDREVIGRFREFGE